MNGVTHSILRVLEHLEEQGHDVLVIAPSTHAVADAVAEFVGPAEVVHGAKVHRVPAVPLAGYTNVRVAMGGVYRVKRILADYAPDVVHLASPFILGWRAVQAAHQLRIPTIAIYQTEVPSYAARYGVPFLENWAWNRVENIHLLATRTLVPSTFALNQLRGRGIPRVAMWRRGVDTARFSPEKRDAGWRASVAPGGERIIGYVGRLAIEKQVEDLAALANVPNSRLVIVGDGPQRAALQEALPGRGVHRLPRRRGAGEGRCVLRPLCPSRRVRDVLPDHPGGHGIGRPGGGHGPRRSPGPGGKLPHRLAVPARGPRRFPGPRDGPDGRRRQAPGVRRRRARVGPGPDLAGAVRPACGAVPLGDHRRTGARACPPR